MPPHEGGGVEAAGMARWGRRRWRREETVAVVTVGCDMIQTIENKKGERGEKVRKGGVSENAQEGTRASLKCSPIGAPPAPQSRVYCQ